MRPTSSGAQFLPCSVIMCLGGALQVWRLGDGSGTIDRDPGEAPRPAGAPKSAAAEKEERDAPRMWLNDSLATVCMNDACKLPFTLSRRKTHCRHCGRIFCGKVSERGTEEMHVPVHLRLCLCLIAVPVVCVLCVVHFQQDWRGQAVPGLLHDAVVQLRPRCPSSSSGQAQEASGMHLALAITSMHPSRRRAPVQRRRAAGRQAARRRE